jgi:hypothetical protein
MKDVGILIFVMILFSCSKSSDDKYDFPIYMPGNTATGLAKANVFDKFWVASAWISKDFPLTDNFALYFETFSKEGYLREQISLGVFNNSSSHFEVNDTFDSNLKDNVLASHYTLFQDDGDVICAGYSINNKSDILITEVDSVSRRIYGKFNLHYYLIDKAKNVVIEQKVSFKDGEFIVKF